MTTNGLLIDQEMLDVCKQYDLTSFQITLDGSKEQHDKVRFISEGKGSYEKIVSNIKLIEKNDLYVHARINWGSETLNSISEIIEDFNDLTEQERSCINFNIHQIWQVEENLQNRVSDARMLFRNNN